MKKILKGGGGVPQGVDMPLRILEQDGCLTLGVSQASMHWHCPQCYVVIVQELVW